jgi:hypothetical protein
VRFDNVEITGLITQSLITDLLECFDGYAKIEMSEFSEEKAAMFSEAPFAFDAYDFIRLSPVVWDINKGYLLYLHPDSLKIKVAVRGFKIVEQFEL